MSNNCPFCVYPVDKCCLQCDKCDEWIHYSCSKLPAYMLVQLSKSNRAFTCHTCVKSKFHLVFNQLHEEIEEIISKQDGQLISPTTCEAQPLIPLSPTAPLPPLIIQVSPKPLSPSAPLLTYLVAPTPSIIHPTQTSVATPQPPSLKNQIPSSSPANKPACKFYMQGRCKNGRKGTNCSFPHPKMCFRFIRSGNKGCNKGSSCQYAHPKLCKASLTSKRCDRRNCYYYHVAGTSRPLTDISVPAHRQLNSKPTPLMQIDVPYLQNPISTLPQIVSHLPPKTPVPIPQVSVPQVPVPQVPVHQVPVNISPSNEPSIFLEQLKELKMQMTQLQQMHSYLIQSLIDRTWPPLTKNQPLQAPIYMTQ